MGRMGLPAILKTRRFGYDGKGQVKMTGQVAPAVAWAEIGKAPAILEGLVHFEREVSVIAARGWDGSVAFYDVPVNVHENGILRTSTVPAGLSPALEVEARAIASKIVAELGYVGVIGIEMFATASGLTVNELAPRVHNSGHWTMDACAVSQFEQHIRAVCGWPLGDTARHSNAVMRNLLGHEVDEWQGLAKGLANRASPLWQGRGAAGPENGPYKHANPSTGLASCGSSSSNLAAPQQGLLSLNPTNNPV